MTTISLTAQPPTKAGTGGPPPRPAVRTIYVVRGRPGPEDRPALPPGHPDTWGRITHGTCIEGAPYPFPVFLP